MIEAQLTVNDDSKETDIDIDKQSTAESSVKISKNPNKDIKKRKLRLDYDLSQSIYYLLIIPRCVQYFTQPYIPRWAGYLLSTFTIFIEMYRTFRKGKKYDEIAVPILAITLVQALISVFTEDEQYLNAPEVILPLIVGITFFISFFFERNLIAHIDGKSKGDSPEGEHYRTEIWKSADYRFSTGLLTVMWGVGMLSQAGFLILMDIVDASDFDIYSFYGGIVFQLFLTLFTEEYVDYKKKQYEKAGYDMSHIKAQELEVKEMILA
ncbi:hypothetical protein HK103_006247 [Boothiomyces macroporosus]|uniref:Uncharacterized protein n=1 Tax=Boothiomyces macroporosus TaxID=261099 RepID=A0AAD5UE27_9FUNG|nr:hypothetical protein HK103_006247 [Boothiomyces macroporosus]